jgi:hypothetical protein
MKTYSCFNGTFPFKYIIIVDIQRQSLTIKVKLADETVKTRDKHRDRVVGDFSKFLYKKVSSQIAIIQMK